LREREFQAGGYNPVIPIPNFPVGPHSPAPGAQHATMAAASAAADADRTRSILHLGHGSGQPQLCAATPMPDAPLPALFGTAHTTREMVENNHDFWEDLERGQGIYIVLYKDDQPDEIFFAGYSFD